MKLFYALAAMVEGIGRNSDGRLLFTIFDHFVNILIQMLVTISHRPRLLFLQLSL